MKHFDRFRVQIQDHDSAYLAKAGIEWIPELIDTAVVIDASNVGKYIKEHDDIDLTSIPGYVPPFETVWWETSFVPFKSGPELQRYLLNRGVSHDEIFKYGPNKACTAIGAFSITQDFGVKNQSPADALEEFQRIGGVNRHDIYFLDSGSLPRWVVRWEIFFAFGRMPLIPRTLRYLVCRDGSLATWEDGKPLLALHGSDVARPNDTEGRFTDQDFIDFVASTADINFKRISSFIMAIGFTHCKNVEIVDGQRAEGALRKKQEKKIGVPLARFKELVIDPSVTQKRQEVDKKQPQQRGTRSLHIARGNFATYSDDKPLFGKYAGTFWRPAHVRGAEKIGIVGKDYTVNAPKS